jgi:hypothetical protein
VSFDNYWDVSAGSGSHADKGTATKRRISKQTDMIDDNIENNTVASNMEEKQRDSEGSIEPQRLLCFASPSNEAEAEKIMAVDQVRVHVGGHGIAIVNNGLTLLSLCTFPPFVSLN